MAQFFTPQADEISAPTSTGTAVDVSNAQVVRCVNSATSAYLVTIEEADGTNVGIFTLAGGESAFILKNKFHKMFAGNASVKFCKASYPRG